jgi:TIR domain
MPTPYTFISHDIDDAQSATWALWLAEQLRDAQSPLDVVVPHQSWTLGWWTSFLQYIIEGAQAIILVLAPSYWTSPAVFLQRQRELVFQKPESLLLIVLLGHEQALGNEEEIAALQRVPILDIRSLLHAQASCRQTLLECLGRVPASFEGSSSSAPSSHERRCS